MACCQGCSALCRYIKCIITRDSTLILGADQGSVKVFVGQLQQKLQDSCESHAGHNQRDNLHLPAEAINDLPYELRVLEVALDNVSLMHRQNIHFLCGQGKPAWVEQLPFMPLTNSQSTTIVQAMIFEGPP